MIKNNNELGGALEEIDLLSPTISWSKGTVQRP